jgi:basic membrane lipoprotein Med (substrate-binding protein (PBP1-ABC) superfamily)/DNA-binding SARP family transcriptional activator
MEFRVLGALEAGAGAAMADLGPPKQRALLAILVLHVGEIVSVDRLIELLWGEGAPRTAAHSIQIYVSELRKALEPIAGRRLIHRRPPGYQLEASADEVDAKRFERLVATGLAQMEAGDRAAATATFRQALELWHGPALSDFAYEEFAQPYVQRFGDLHLDAVEALAAAELEAGKTTAVISLLEAAIRDDPLRERSRELLMTALYRAGRHPEALRTYDKFRELLVEELGLEPSPPLQQLRDRMLLHDPDLVPIATSQADGASARNPYKGLRAFGEEDASDFYGRDVLVDRLVDMIGSGQRLVALVGPSGSGKSSVVAAGLLPRLRGGAIPGSGSWAVAAVTPGPDPASDVRAAVTRATQRAVPPDGLVPKAAGTERIVLVIDQFEQMFTAADEARRTAFLTALAAEATDEASPLIVVLALRADYYDRPLQHPEFGAVFVPGVVHVLPMTARDLEAAIVAPADGVGVRVEPKLLAELVAETAASPGSLPLLQYALTELFDQRSGSVVTLGAYTALGGLRGILSRRAEAAFLGLDAEGQRTATQVFLRLVRLGRGTADSRRRLTLTELTEVSADAVVLSDVLTTFGRHRLLTFDHDPDSGEATVELAHEALLTEWERLAGWIDRYRSALRRRDALATAVDEWELAGRDADYLLTGRRLTELDDWAREGTLRLTARERQFLEAGLARDHAAAEAESARTEEHRKLARTARLRLIGLAAAVVILLGSGAAWFAFASQPELRPVAFLFTDENIINVQVTSGFDRAVRDFDLTSRKYPTTGIFAAIEEERGADWFEGLSETETTELADAMVTTQLREASSTAGMVVMIGIPIWVIEPVAEDHPDVQYLVDQPSDLPNVSFLRFDDSEASFLAGAVAALTTETGVIGYIGGVDYQFIWGFQAGYEAGARTIDPDIEIVSTYLSTPEEWTGFNDAPRAQEVATELYEAGADVIMHASGNSGLGLFEGARQYSAESGRHVWAIGVDTDQYETVVYLPSATNPEAWRPHILTSVLKEIDTLTYSAIAEYADGTFAPGMRTWGLESGATGISYSGGFLEEHRERLEELEARIIAGEIVVPCVPDDRQARAEEIGLSPDYCRADS